VRFGPYELVERIGSGGMAEVHRARALDAGFDRPVAVKLIHPQLCDDDTWVQMFTDEARLMAQLHHANIVQVFDFGEVGGRYYLAMELVDGADLGWLIDSLDPGKPIPVSIGVYIALEVCRGLAHAHGKRGPDGQLLGLVHRDISPPNVLLSWEGEVKLTDFGIAKARRRAVETTQGKIKGKFAYMAPEQVRGEPLDERTDLFALGALMHELLTGRPLFQEESPAATIRKVMHAPVPPPSQQNPLVPPELDAIVQRALSRDPPLRYQSADALHAELLACARATTGTLLTSDLGAWMQGRRREAHGTFDEVDSDTRVERVVAGRMHGLLSAPVVSAPSPEPYFATRAGEGREAQPERRDARVTRDDLPRQRRRGRVQRGGSAIATSTEETVGDASALAPSLAPQPGGSPDLDDSPPSTLRVPKMAQRPMRVDSAELAADDDEAPTGVTFDETARAVASVSPPLGVPMGHAEELAAEEATRVRLDDQAFGVESTVPSLPAIEDEPVSTVNQLDRGAAAGHYDLEMGVVEGDSHDGGATVRHVVGGSASTDGYGSDLVEEAGTVRHVPREPTPEPALVDSSPSGWGPVSSESPPETTGPLPLPEEHDFDGEATAVSLAALDEATINNDEERTTNVKEAMMRASRERSDTKRLPDMEIVVPRDEARAWADRGERRDTLPDGIPVTGPLPMIDGERERDLAEKAAEAAVAAELAREEELYAFDSDEDPTEAMMVYDPPLEAYPSAEVLVSDRQIRSDADLLGAMSVSTTAAAPELPQQASKMPGPVPMPAPTGPPTPAGVPTDAGQAGNVGTLRDLSSINDGVLELSNDKPASKLWRWVGIVVTLVMLAVASVGAYFLYKRQQERKARRAVRAAAAKKAAEAKAARAVKAAEARAKARAAKKAAAAKAAAAKAAAAKAAEADGGAATATDAGAAKQGKGPKPAEGKP
jgi:serine/threonine protein kinase